MQAHKENIVRSSGLPTSAMRIMQGLKFSACAVKSKDGRDSIVVVRREDGVGIEITGAEAVSAFRKAARGEAQRVRAFNFRERSLHCFDELMAREWMYREPTAARHRETRPGAIDPLLA